jgi:hypothetical protein
MIINPLLTIVRLEDNFQYGTFGVLLIQTNIFCWTLEPKEWENEQQISCIPVGCYELERLVSPTFGTTYEVKNVPNRTSILFHRGNVAKDTKGCILLGKEYGSLKGGRAILCSGDTFTKFLNEMRSYKQANLIIKEMWA